MEPPSLSAGTTPTDPLPQRLTGHEEFILALQETGRMLHARGWSLGTSSNYSVVVQRDPLQLLITASGMDKGQLRGADFVVVDEQGLGVVAEQPASSAETLLHCVLAAQPDVGCILHTHSVWATVLSELFFEEGGMTIGDFEMLKGLEGIRSHQANVWIPILENSQDIRQLSGQVRQQLLECDSPAPHGFLLRQHGLYTWGRDLFAARRHVEIFEFLFECVARKMMLQNSLPTSASLH